MYITCTIIGFIIVIIGFAAFIYTASENKPDKWVAASLIFCLLGTCVGIFGALGITREDARDRERRDSEMLNGTTIFREDGVKIQFLEPHKFVRVGKEYREIQ